ncbi:hypothetical protein X948_4569 [Burkholderia pseudomallei MSHR5608]|nr:hypothetical protein X948_4569 [Burkholderia pseudomallei MSHR5608]
MTFDFLCIVKACLCVNRRIFWHKYFGEHHGKYEGFVTLSIKGRIGGVHQATFQENI